MKHHIHTIATFCLLFFLGASASAQGLYWESAVTRNGESDTTVSRSYYMPGMFKETGSSRDQQIIVRLDKKLFIMVNDGDKEYSELTFDEMEQMMKKVTGKMSGAMAEMEKQMKNLTPDQQKMMKEMMGGKLPGMKETAKIEVSKTGDTKKISGYSCSKHVVKRGGEGFLTLWTTDDIKGVGAMGDEMKEFAKRMAALNPMGDQSESEAMMSVDGFPIQTEMADMTTMVTRVEEKSIPASEFGVPAGYKKVESEILEQFQKMD